MMQYPIRKTGCMNGSLLRIVNDEALHAPGGHPSVQNPMTEPRKLIVYI